MTNSSGHRIQIGVKLPEDLIRRLDQRLATKRFPPTRTHVIQDAIERWLDWDERVEARDSGRELAPREFKREPFEEPA